MENSTKPSFIVPTDQEHHMSFAGQSKQNPKVITSRNIMDLIQMLNDYISRYLSNTKWKNRSQVTIYENQRRYDKITVVYFPEQGKESYMDFWFDTTSCF